MDLVNLDEDLRYTYWSPVENKYIEHTGTLREFINTFADVRFLYKYRFNYVRFENNEKDEKQ